MGRYWLKDTNLQLCRMHKCRDLIGTITILSNTVLSTGNMPREHISGALIA